MTEILVSCPTSDIIKMFLSQNWIPTYFCCSLANNYLSTLQTLAYMSGPRADLADNFMIVLEHYFLLVILFQGFVAAVTHLRSFVPVIYNITVAIPKSEPRPTLLRIFRGRSSVVSQLWNFARYSQLYKKPSWRSHLLPDSLRSKQQTHIIF